MMRKFMIALIAFSPIFSGQAAQELPAPLARWSFDAMDASGVTASKKNPVRFVDGVLGKALVFDGYFTEISVVPEQSPVLGDRFTISAWVASQEYSYNISAIINRQQDFTKGYFFGINQIGQLVGSVGLESGWATCISTSSLPLLKWSNVAMVFDGTKGISLYLDGQQVGHTTVTGSLIAAEAAATTIGKTQVPMTPAMTERHSSRAVKSWMRYDGLIDELDVLGEALSSDDIREAYRKTTVKNVQPLSFRRMPSGSDEPMPFGAYYTQLQYAPGWDALWQGSDRPDVIVRFDDSPVKLVFWRGTGYIPAFVSENGIWMSDQSCEDWGSGECFEVMSDKQCRYSHVRIVENSPARVVIHWRYALTSISYEIFKQSDTYPGDWADEYWTVYPDSDGFSAWEEEFAGTNPTNIASLLRGEGVIPVINGVAFSWQAVNGKSYTVWFKTNLTDSVWTEQDSGIAGVEPSCTYTVETDSATGFVRVGVE
jgi:hypothetical protein